MCIRWLYEALDCEILVELNSGEILKGVLQKIDKRENLTIETKNSTILISSTAVNTVVLPTIIETIMK